MTTTKGRKPRDSFQISHRERALKARQQPGRWTYVRGYGQPETAADAARSIRRGRYAAYQPPGAFEARVIEGPQVWPHRPWLLHARYVGPKET